MWNKPFGFYFLLFIIMVLFFKFYAIIYVFLPAIASGCVFAYLSHPVYSFLLKRTGSKSLSAFTVLFINFALILVPITIIGIAVQQQVQFLLSMNIVNYTRSVLENMDTMLTERYQIQMMDQYITIIMENAQTILKTVVPTMIMSVTQFILSAFIAFFLMYYFLTNSKKIIAVLRYYGPLSDENMDTLLREMGKNTKTLILGQLLIAVIQGTLSAIGFLIFGVPAFLLWGMVSIMTSFLPVLGAGLIWFPAALFLFMSGKYFDAIGLFLWGALIVSTSDNLIRPKLVHLLGEIHPVTVLLGVFIGVKEWGLIGIVIGPLIISVLITLIKMFREQFLDSPDEITNKTSEPTALISPHTRIQDSLS